MKCLIILLCGAIIASAVDLPGFPVDFDLDDKILSDIANDVAIRLEQEYYTYLKTGLKTPTFTKLTAQLAKVHTKKDIFTKDLPELEKRDSFVVCTLCRSMVNVFARTVREEDGELNGENSTAIMKRIAMDVCKRLELQTEEVCDGVITAMLPSAEYIIRNSEIDSKSLCSVFMEFNFCNTVSNPAYNWTLKVDNKGVAPHGHKGDTPRRDASDIKICQFTDIHHDPLYEPGTLAKCDEPMCCQRYKNTTQGTDEAAGVWGDYRDCDLPWRSFESALEHAAKTEKCTYIYQTGDIVDHMVWATSVEKNSEVLTKVSKQFEKVFDVPVFPCIGNHEPHPLNLFSPEGVPDDVSTKWLYEHLWHDWSKWLPAETKETIMKGGYYTTSPQKGFRIISLNSNDCYTSNFWLYHRGNNTIPQLQWFHDTLLAAEKAGEYVHVLTHVPSGDGNCWSVWAREYNRVITRFHKTISGIFTGHTHRDELVVHYSEEGHAISVSWNGGALTTYSNKNPNYRVYDCNSKTFDVTNHRTYIFDLNEANKNPDEQPNWFLEYEFAKEFTDDLSPAGIDKLLDEFADQPALMRKYWRFRVTSAEPQLNRGCDHNCLTRALCGTAVAVNNQRERCEELEQRLLTALDNEKGEDGDEEEDEDENEDENENENGDDGAVTLSVLSITSLLTVVFTMRIGF